jgi:hypothetical protein
MDQNENGEDGHLCRGILGQVGNLRSSWSSSAKLAFFGQIGLLRPSWPPWAKLAIFGQIGLLRPSWQSWAKVAHIECRRIAAAGGA